MLVNSHAGVRQAFTLQPRYGNDVADLVPTLVSNFMDVRSALQDAAQRLRSSPDAASLQSLLGACCPSSCIQFSCSEGQNFRLLQQPCCREWSAC